MLWKISGAYVLGDVAEERLLPTLRPDARRVGKGPLFFARWREHIFAGSHDGCEPAQARSAIEQILHC